MIRSGILCTLVQHPPQRIPRLNIQIWLDEEEVIIVRDVLDPHSIGTIGLYNYLNHGSHYDNILVIKQ